MTHTIWCKKNWEACLSQVTQWQIPMTWSSRVQPTPVHRWTLSQQFTGAWPTLCSRPFFHATLNPEAQCLREGTRRRHLNLSKGGPNYYVTPKTVLFPIPLSRMTPTSFKLDVLIFWLIFLNTCLNFVFHQLLALSHANFLDMRCYEKIIYFNISMYIDLNGYSVNCRTFFVWGIQLLLLFVVSPSLPVFGIEMSTWLVVFWSRTSLFCLHGLYSAAPSLSPSQPRH